MTLTHDADVATPHVPAPPPRPRSTWYISAGLALILAIAAAGWWIAGSTVTAADYDAVLADLRSAEAAAAALDGELTGMRVELAAARDEAADLRTELADERLRNDRLNRQQPVQAGHVRALEEQVADLRSAVDSALVVAQAFGYIGLHLSPEPLANLELAGADFALADDVLSALGESQTLTEWAGFASAMRRDGAIRAIGDDTLDGAWSRWMEEDVASIEEAAAWYEMWWRLSWLLLNPLSEVR